MLPFTLAIPSHRPPVGGVAESFERTAFVSSTGNDGTGVLNDPELPFETLASALTALDAAHQAEDITLRLIDAVEEIFAITPARCVVGVTLKGHGGPVAVPDLSVITFGGPADGGFGSNGYDGGTITLDEIALDTFNGSGGTGEGGTPGDLGQPGGTGGEGGDGGNVILLNGSTVTNFTSLGGAGGLGGTDGGSGAGSPGADGNPGQLITP